MKHNKEGDLWIILGGKVYDISSWGADHPGGIEPLLAAAKGKDEIAEFEDIHSARAQKKKDQFYIGDLLEA